MACDPYWNQVVLALHMDGTNGSTTFTDSSPSAKTVTANGNAQISTAQSKFGGASAYFDGTGDSLTAHSETLSGDFTIELWVYLTTAPTSQFLVGCGNDAASTGFLLNVNTSGQVNLFGNNTGLIAGSGSSILNTWTHVALSRSGSTIGLFVAGTQLGSVSISKSFSGTVRIGAEDYNGTITHRFTGYIDDLRITKGVARYTANFTPPAAPFPNQLPVISGVVKDASGNLAERLVRAYLRSSGKLLGQTLSNPATGDYSIPVESDKECFVVCHDSSANPPSGGTENAVILDRVIPI